MSGITSAAEPADPHRRGAATAATVAVFGTAAGIAGIEHGVGEILQGDVVPDGVVIASWPASEAFRVLGGEPAMTVVPNLLASGILAILVSLVLLVVAVTPLARRRGGGPALIEAVGRHAAGRCRVRSTADGRRHRGGRDQARCPAARVAPAGRSGGARPSVAVVPRRGAGRVAVVAPGNGAVRAVRRNGRCRGPRRRGAHVQCARASTVVDRHRLGARRAAGVGVRALRDDVLLSHQDLLLTCSTQPCGAGSPPADPDACDSMIASPDHKHHAITRVTSTSCTLLTGRHGTSAANPRTSAGRSARIPPPCRPSRFLPG
jgi:hypothetical protein